MPTASYPKRTEKNILDSDGTLIFSRGTLTGGSALTRKIAKQHERPWLHVDLDKVVATEAVQMIAEWVDGHGIQIVNVAGPRASKDPGIHDFVLDILERVWEA
jgi:hypothetical protein